MKACIFPVLLVCSICNGSPWSFHVYHGEPPFPYERAPTKSLRPQLSPLATNLALNQKVTSSDSFPIIGDLSLITDGISTYPPGREEGHYCEISDGKQWVQVDLGEECMISLIGLWYRHDVEEYEIPLDVVVQISSKEDFNESITVFNCDFDDSMGLGSGSDIHFASSKYGKFIETTPSLKGRYVRVWGNGGFAYDWNRFVEVKVFGISKALEDRFIAESVKKEEIHSGARSYILGTAIALTTLFLVILMFKYFRGKKIQQVD